jgi:Predicted metal-dependent enzyme
MDLKKIFIKDACPTKMGGQAVMEGIMMKGEEKTALAVRIPNGNIEIETKRTKTYGKWMKVPIIRGVVAFIDALVFGTKTLMDSADILAQYEDEEYEQGKFEAWFEKKFGSEALWKLLVTFSVIIALAFSIGLFILLPTWVASAAKLISHNVIWINLVEGLLRIALFIGYIWAVSFMPDMKRVFRFHGAEHKTIHAVENLPQRQTGGPDMKGLTVAECRQYPTLHPRCGTSFLMFVFIIALFCHVLLGWPVLWVRIVTRLLLLPVVAGLSYELLKWAGRSDNWAVKILSMPGLWLQKITTAEPDDEMLEVAIEAMKAVCDDTPPRSYTVKPETRYEYPHVWDL